MCCISYVNHVFYVAKDFFPSLTSMTPRNLFNIILKVLGIFFLRDFLVSLPQLLSLISIWINYSGDGMISPVIATIISVLAYAYIAYMLILRTEVVIDKLNLLNGFKDEILPLNLHRSVVLNISIIVVGLLLVIQSIPGIIHQVILYFERIQNTYGVPGISPGPETTRVVFLIAELIIGLLLIGNNRKIVNFIELRRKARPAEDT